MTYDAIGNRLSLPSTVSTHTTYSGTVYYYNASVGTSSAYDYKNELTYETSTGRVPSGYTNTFGYDTAGNFTTLRGTSVAAANPDNQLSATGYTYDGNGNPTSYSGSTLTFDPENRMTSYVSSGTTEMSAGYGADGLRAWRIDNSGNKVYYLYDGDNPVVQLVGSSGSSLGTINLVNCFGANGLINRNFSGNQHSKFYAFDPQGSVAQRVASDGSVDASFAFDSFGGRAVTTSSSVPMNDSYCGFGGQWGYWYDSMTGLELLTNRYFDPANGRFATRNPAGYNNERLLSREITSVSCVPTRSVHWVPESFAAIAMQDSMIHTSSLAAKDCPMKVGLYGFVENDPGSGSDDLGLDFVSLFKGKPICSERMWELCTLMAWDDAKERSKLTCEVCFPCELSCVLEPPSRAPHCTAVICCKSD